jgi:hypothetical protein
MSEEYLIKSLPKAIFTLSFQAHYINTLENLSCLLNQKKLHTKYLPS